MFVNETDSSNIIRVSRDKATNLHKVTENTIDDELADLGYDKSNLLQSQAVVFVEGKSDERILIQLARNAGFDLQENNIETVELDGEGNIRSDGRSLVKLLYQMDIPYRFILDSHGDDPDEVADEHTSEINDRKGDWYTTPEQFIVWFFFFQAEDGIRDVR